MREALEPYAAGKAARRITRPQLDEIRQQFQRMRSLAELARESGRKTVGKRLVQKSDAADLAFHMLILEATGNRRILEALERGDAEAARTAMAQHVRNSLDRTLARQSGPTDRWWDNATP